MRISMRQVLATRELRRLVGAELYQELAPVLRLDQGAGTQYSKVIATLVRETPDREQLPALLPRWADEIMRLDGIFKDLKEPIKLLDRIQAVQAEDPQSTRDALAFVLKHAVHAQAPYGKPQDAAIEVISADIIATDNFEASSRLHGDLAPKSRQHSWCTGSSRINFARYSPEGGRRYIVFPNGPSTQISVGEYGDIPWSNDAIVMTVMADGRVANVNDAMNRHSDDPKFDWTGANKAAALLSAALGVVVDLKASGNVALDEGHMRDVVQGAFYNGYYEALSDTFAGIIPGKSHWITTEGRLIAAPDSSLERLAQGMTAGNLHLYEDNLKAAYEVAQRPDLSYDLREEVYEMQSSLDGVYLSETYPNISSLFDRGYDYDLLAKLFPAYRDRRGANLVIPQLGMIENRLEHVYSFDTMSPETVSYLIKTECESLQDVIHLLDLIVADLDA